MSLGILQDFTFLPNGFTLLPAVETLIHQGLDSIMRLSRAREHLMGTS